MKNYLLPLLLTLGVMAGCAPVAKVPDSIPVVGNSVDRAQAHVESAESLVTRAVPESSPTGKSLLAAATDEQDKAISDLNDTKKELTQVTQERDKVDADREALAKELAQIKSGWGYRLQQFVLRMFWLIVSLTALHFVLGIVALFVSGPVGNVLAKIGAFVNPFAWFQTLRDNHFFNKKCPDPSPPPHDSHTSRERHRLRGPALGAHVSPRGD
jgi:hypothetical protein